MSDTITNSRYRSLSKEQKGDLIRKMIELRKGGRPLNQIAEAGGVSRGWACKLMKKAGIPIADEIVDKNGRKRHSHGMRRTSEYSSYMSMRTRCCDPNHPTYKNYGARGITMDARWLNFNEFLADMGQKPGKGYSIERIDNEKGYCKENCIWLLRKLQNRNTRSTVLTAEQVMAIRQEYANGKRQYLIAKEYGIKPSHVTAIIKRKCWKDI